MKVFIEKRGSGKYTWHTCFSQGVQKFVLSEGDTKTQEQWRAKMLRDRWYKSRV